MKGDSADGRYFHALTARPDARNTMPSRVGQPVITPQGVTDKHWTLLAADGKLIVSSTRITPHLGGDGIMTERRKSQLSVVARILLAGPLLAPMVGWAGTWSSCQTITSFTDYTSYSNSIYLNLSPGMSGCATDTNGGVIMRINTAGVTADQYKNLYATIMLSYSLGKQVMVYADTSATPACFISIVSIGGYANQCN